jgi:hypothetical protein
MSIVATFDGGTASYERRVTAALDSWSSGSCTRNILEYLASLLDCPHMGSTMKAMVIPSSSPATEAFVLCTWMSVLGGYEGSASKSFALERHLVAGFLQNNRWQLLIATESGARRWATLVARYLAHMPGSRTVLSDADIAMDRLVMDALHSVLGSWCQEYPYIATQHDLATALFGVVWCEMVFDCRAPSSDLATLIEITEPAFVPGRLAIGAAVPPHVLPLLE